MRGPELQIGALFCIGLPTLSAELQKEDAETNLGKPALASATAWASASLPDLIEPAIHPNHRQFFHSITFGVFVCWLFKQAYEWEPDEPQYEIVRIICLAILSAYIIHLAMDFSTPKGLPVI